ncbi:MAG: hypothetical protein CMJ11_08145 [Pelagibacterales bacterium]|nr:hypothetical protein [Pelagibacterales bacterium]|tara:strand:- start:1821 stop:2474 length:654 start_codon:yes stop_codon:yes gene_type:complete
MRILLYTLLIIIISLKAHSFDDDCIKSDNFPFCLYDNNKQEFIIIRNEKEVGWHKVEFQKTSDGFNIISSAYIKARYLLFLDYIFEYSSTSIWKNNQLQENIINIDDDGNDYSILIKRIDENKIEITNEENEIYIHEGNNIFPSDHWHPYEIRSKYLLNTLNGEVLEIDVEQIDSNTWYIDGKVKYYVNYDDKGRWTGLKFDADEDDIIEYKCITCD